MATSYGISFLEQPRVGRPVPVVDEARARANIARMAAKARASGAVFRPHFKTHQSHAIGEWFRDEGVSAITVSSLCMAEYFARCGWRDITVAFPVNLRELDAVEALAAEIDLGVLADSTAAVEGLRAALSRRVRVWIKVDTGYGRAGLAWDGGEALAALARAVDAAPRLDLAGLLTHAGHSYHQEDAAGIRRVHAEQLSRLGAAAAALRAAGLDPGTISIGDTPTCSVVEDLTGAGEIRPGNFVFYDLTQRALGVCRDEDLAVAVACPVVSVQPARQRALLYGGAVHLSKEALRDARGETIFGCLARDAAPDYLGAPDWRAPLVSLSQEHGIVALSEADALRPGDLALVYPVHSCLACDLHRAYRTLSGETLPKL